MSSWIERDRDTGLSKRWFNPARRPPPDKLTLDEIVILRRLDEGQKVKQIAASLSCGVAAIYNRTCDMRRRFSAIVGYKISNNDELLALPQVRAQLHQ